MARRPPPPMHDWNFDPCPLSSDGLPTQQDTKNSIWEKMGQREAKSPVKSMPDRNYIRDLSIVAMHGKETQAFGRWADEESGSWTQFKYYARHSFHMEGQTLHRVKTKTTKLEDGSEAISVTALGKPVTPIEAAYNILMKHHVASGKNGNHGGRDTTYNSLKKESSTIPKDIVHSFIQLCPSCYFRTMSTQNGHLKRVNNQASGVEPPLTASDVSIPSNKNTTFKNGTVAAPQAAEKAASKATLKRKPREDPVDNGEGLASPSSKKQKGAASRQPAAYDGPESGPPVLNLGESGLFDPLVPTIPTATTIAPAEGSFTYLLGAEIDFEDLAIDPRLLVAQQEAGSVLETFPEREPISDLVPDVNNESLLDLSYDNSQQSELPSAGFNFYGSDADLAQLLLDDMEAQDQVQWNH